MNRYLYFLFFMLPYYAGAQQMVGLSRFDDEFYSLKNDSLHKYVPLPALKAINLNHDGSSNISFGGELREQFQIFNNENWGKLSKSGESNSGRIFILHRLMIYSNLNISRYFSLFGELKNNLEANRKTGPRPGIDEDQIDLHQLFADVMLYPSNKIITLRIGRQELNYGASRLISVSDGLNSRTSFQGYKVILKRKRLYVESFYVNPVLKYPGVFDNKIDNSQQLYGIYATTVFKAEKFGKLDAYYFRTKNDHEVYYSGTGMEKRNSFGLRWYSDPKTPFNFDAEYVQQTGSFLNKKIKAYMAVLILGYKFMDYQLKPSFNLVGQIASGDKGTRNQQNTFNPLYARDYYGVGMPYWSSNLTQFSLVLKIEPTPKLSVDADIRALWRTRINDGLYFPGGPSRSPFLENSMTFSDNRFVGYQYDVNMVYQFTGYLTLGAGISGLPATQYIKETGSSGDIFFANMQARLKF